MKRVGRIVLCVAAITIILCTMGCARKNKEKVVDSWPTSELAKLIDQPDFGELEINIDSDDTLSLDLNNVDKADYKAYVEKCKEKFPIDHYGTSTSYRGKNENGYSISLSYYETWKGSMTIYVRIPSEDEEEDNDDEILEEENLDDENAIEGEEDPAYDEDEYSESTSASSEIEEKEDAAIDNSSDSNDTTLDSQKDNISVDPDLKEFLDAYEEFVDEYCVFMKKYMNADLTEMVNMLDEYTKYCDKLTELEEKMNKYDESKMTSADAIYYLEVCQRCTDKMLSAY